MEAEGRFYRPQGAPIARLDPAQDRCPTCKQPLGTRAADLKRTRVCLNCGLAIGRHDKFTISPDGLRHRNCEDPEDYT